MMKFEAKIREETVIQQEESANANKRKLAQNNKRITELDRLFRKTYEDNANEKLSDRRFEQLSREYEREQAELETQNKQLASEITAYVEDSEKSERFIELVKRYTQFDELTNVILNEFISRVEIHEADKSSGERVQDVDVYFRFIGRFSPPQEEYVPTPEELAEAEKLRIKRAKQREANRRWYAKKKAEQATVI